MQVSLQALKAFESAARLGSFKLAAEELSLTPTAISHHVSNLESRLNVDLFYRQVRKISLTETGEKLASAISDGFRTIEDALEEVSNVSRMIKITTTSSLAAMILIPSMQGFSQMHPEIAVEISTGESLDNHLYALPIRYGAVSSVSPSDIIKYESFNVFAAAGLSMSTWKQQPIKLLSTEWKNRALPEPPLTAWLIENGVAHPKIELKCYDQEIFGIQEALASDGLVFCSTTLVSRLIHSKLLQPLPTNAVRAELCYYIPNKAQLKHRSRNLNELITWIENQLNQ
ncbi:LysR family transcriptional regulator [Acinetobacter genomosp. 15BJ]|uniref:LysR family transcriptional regulator n=1 Tax=Acinetobacter genomosp. 15BJ TaxID=106651 RepID=A0ABT8UUU3_9GAMM|nr:LysR family transcriptional regulator [Acinetobacter genomosp. 15BJ]MDO3656162.1 LysR family transcriptional regulator [Acinetobacter genomosp. 15BJ]